MRGLFCARSGCSRRQWLHCTASLSPMTIKKQETTSQKLLKAQKQGERRQAIHPSSQK